MSKKFFTLIQLLFFSTLLLAQEQDTIQLDEVEITGLKVEMPARETAKPVEIISREEIERSAGKDVSQLLQEQAGIVVNGAYSNPAAAKSIYMRGASNDYTLILINGIPVNDPSGIGGAIDLRLMPLAQIERIEILKGSQSTLYGSDAMAGVINIITKHEHIDKPINVYGGSSYGSMNTWKANIGVQGQIKPFTYDVSAIRNVSDGINSATNNTDSLSFDKDGYTQQGLQSHLRYKLNDNWQISADVRYEDFEGEYDADAFMDAPNEFKSELFNPGGEIEYKNNGIVGRLTYNYTSTDRRFDSDFGPSVFEGHLHNTEAFVKVPVQENVSLIGGVNFQRHKMIDTAAVVDEPKYDITSPFITLILKGWGNGFLETGFRYNNHSEYGDNSTYSFAPSYWVTDEIKAFASFTSGFKAPTLSQLYGQFGANEDLEPQTSETVEVGINYVTQEDLIDAQVTYYRRKVDNIINYSFSQGYFNQDKQEDEGVELAARFKPLENLILEASYDYVTGQVYTVNDAEEDTTYYNLVRRPKSKVSFSINYKPIQKLNVSLSTLYMGDRIDYFFNPQNNFQMEEVDLERYFLVNAYVDYKILDDKLTFYVDLKNILDTDYTETYGYNTLGFNADAGINFMF